MACYACARVLEIAPTPIPRVEIVLLEVLSAMAFALTDGARRYGFKGILIFADLCVLVGNVIENIGVVTGIPFGRYYFAESMGPKLFHVPMHRQAMDGCRYYPRICAGLHLCYGFIGCDRMDEDGARHQHNYRLKSSRSRRVCARLTGISVCFLSFMRS